MSLKTVDVPKEFEPVFARAEEVVSSYFAGRSHDPSRAAIEIGGERYILVRGASLSIEFFSLVKRLFGAGREADANEFARNILFDLSHAIGKSDADNFHAEMHLEDPVARLSAGPVHFSHSGWAFVKIFPESNPSPDQDYFLIYDHPESFEADAWLRNGQRSDTPVCVMNAGYSSGWCESSFGLPLVAVEILCRAKGDPCCRFIMAPPGRIAEHVARYAECQCGQAHRLALGGVPEFFARKRLEDELRKSESRLSRAMSIAHLGFWEWNVVTNDLYWSKELYRIFDVPPEKKDLTYDVFINRVHPEDRESVQRHVDAALNEDASYDIEYRIALPDGQAHYAHAQGEVSRDRDGSPRSMVGTVMDITERKEAEKALREKDEQLRQSQKLEAMGQLAGGIAHEFNNLLQAISGYGGYAMEGLASEDQRHQDLQQVRKAADRAAVLTRQLLGFGRRQILERKNVDPNTVVADLAKLVRPVIGERIELDLTLGENVGTVFADPGELQQLLLNLCLNARDAMPSGGKLLISTENVVLRTTVTTTATDLAPGRYGVLSVTDTGCGMTPEVKERIFEPFFTTKKVGEGTGLGLATIYGIVQQHGGAIGVYSEPGRGTTFKIYLPTVDVAADADDDQQKTDLPGGTETILVAEDEPVVRRLAVRILRQAGYQVLDASNGEEALRVYDKHREGISLLMLDAVMPGLNGREVYDRLRADNQDVKVVFCTGYDAKTARSGSIEVEGLHLIQKPFDPAALLCSVREVLDQDLGKQCLMEQMAV